MNNKTIKSDFFTYLKPKFKFYCLICLLSVVLLSESVRAKATLKQTQIAQQPTTNQQDATQSPAAKAYEEGMALYQQGTAESLRQAIEKLQVALVLWQKAGDQKWQATTLNNIGAVYDDLGEEQKALEYYNSALSLRRAVGDKGGEANSLTNIGGVYLDLGEKQKALEYFNNALPLRRAAGDKGGEALTLNNIGAVYDNLGEEQKALEYYNNALSLRRAIGNKSGEANTLTNIAGVYDDLGEKQKALEYYNNALSLRRAMGDKRGEANTLTYIGGVYDNLGEKQKALEYYNNALSLRRAMGDKRGEASTLTHIGGVYSDLGKKQKALEYFNNALPLVRTFGDKDGEADTLTNIGQIYSDLGEKQKALEYFNSTLPMYRAVGDRRGEALTLNHIGAVYSDLGEKQKALEYFNSALPLRRAVGDRRGEANTLTYIGLVYSHLGEKQKALEYFNSALPIQRAVSDKGGEANILTNIGLVYNDLWEKQKALEYFNSALPIQRAVSDKGGEAVTLANIGIVYADLWEKQKALEYFNNALSLLRTVGDKLGEAATLHNIGAVYNNLEEKQKALEYFNSALSLRRAVGDRRGEASTLSNIGDVYNDLGEKQKALEYFNSALPLRRVVGDRGGEAITLNNIGGVYDDLGKKQKALEYFNSALPLRRAVGDRHGEATTLTAIGYVYDTLGKKQKALESYNSALLLRRAVGDRRGEAITLNNIGYLYDNLGEKQKALEYFNSALPLSRTVGDKSGETTTLGNIAYLERSRGNLQAARTNVEAAIKIIEELRTKIDSKELRSSYFATKQHLYKFYIDLLMELHKKEPSQGYDALALHYSERSRARSLIELLNEAHAKIFKGANPQSVAQERNLRQQIDAKDTLRRNLQTSASNNTPKTQASIQKLTTEITNLLAQYQEIQAKIRTSNPVYAKLTNPDPEKDILKLPQIQQQLDKDTLLLQYSLGDEHSYLWAVTPTSMQAYTLPPRKEIEEVATKFHSSLQAGTASDLSISRAKKLTQLILTPVVDKLARKRLVIVADGALQTIPFAALADISANKYQPLMVNHEIVNLPSASTIAFQRQQLAKRHPAPKALAILADPVYSATDERVTAKPEKSSLGSNLDLERSALERSARSLKRNGWDRLKNTATEAKEILKLIPAANTLEAVNFDANYNWATSSTLSQFRILHFATHGFVNSDQPELSGIVLSLVDKKGNPISGYLRLEDLFNQDYPAELIVLSACETGLGKNVNGEGLVGLTRGLMYAGAARVVVSLWQVSDEGTSVLMQEFYKQMLQQGKTPAQALRAAQSKLWQEGRSPYEWAAFTLQGEWR